MRYILCVMLVLGVLGCGDGGKVAAVGGRSITAADFDAYLKLKHIDNQDESRRKALLEQYMQREALAAAIEKTDLIDKQQLQAEVNEFRKEALISRYFDRFLKEQLSDESVRKYYDAHLEAFSEKQVHVAHILIRTHSMMTQEQRQAMLAKANKIHDQIKKGQPFAEMAKQHSQDKATADKGGDMGWIQEEAMGKQFSDVAFKLPAGEVSNPVETPFGYDLIAVLEPVRSVKKPFETVAGQIRHQLKKEARSTEMERLLASVKVKIK